MEFSPRGVIRRDHRSQEEITQESNQNSPEAPSFPPPSTSSSSPSPSASSSSHWAPHPEPTEREHMFEKVVTPSDVGKLNRLVIPKQHAERYFPLDPASNDKGGLLLNFEEERTGRPWRFRYSYWNSSQSYVMTKGWSRFVKDKHLDAGDTVSFSRSITGARLFIDWRRRPPPLSVEPIFRSVIPSWAAGCSWPPIFPPSSLYFRSTGHTLPPLPPSLPHQHHHQLYGHGILDSIPLLPLRRPPVRLFGVDLHEHHVEDEAPSPLQWRLLTDAPPPSELQLMPPPPARSHEK